MYVGRVCTQNQFIKMNHHKLVNHLRSLPCIMCFNSRINKDFSFGCNVGSLVKVGKIWM
ncbi:hypothetical protein ACS0TY_019029 [Phlomoides rotata]